MPLLFAYTHILLTGTPTQNIWAIFCATLGIVLTSIVATAFLLVRMTLVEWLLLAAAAVLAFIPFVTTVVAAVAIFAAVYLKQKKRAEAAAVQIGAQPV
jgi:TRAP-type uncharacterized transport system fused permease subunit